MLAFRSLPKSVSLLSDRRWSDPDAAGARKAPLRPTVAEAAFYRLPLAAFGTQLLLAIVGIIVGLDAAWTDVTAATAQVEPQQ